MLIIKITFLHAIFLRVCLKVVAWKQILSNTILWGHLTTNKTEKKSNTKTARTFCMKYKQK